MNLAAVILTKNEARHIIACIESVAWADEIVVFDSFSEDETIELAQTVHARVLQHPFQNFAGQRNAALEVLEADWIFFIDADERATPELGAEARRVIQRKNVNGWWVPRHNYIFGRLTLGAGWYPDYQMRLLRRGYARYEREVHEVVVLEGAEGRMENPLVHYNYDTLAQFHAKQNSYTDYDAQILFKTGTRPRLRNYILQPLRQFYWRFITLKGYRDRLHGLRLAMLLAYYNWQLYRRLGRLWREQAFQGANAVE